MACVPFIRFVSLLALLLFSTGSSHPKMSTAAAGLSSMLWGNNVNNHRSSPLPIILDTDIGQDFDDSWALAEAIARPDLWDLKLVLTDHDNTIGRAQIVAKYLEAYKRTDVPIGIGVYQNTYVGSLYPWAQDYDLDRYPGTVFKDGVAAAAGIIMKSPEPIAIIAIAPDVNFVSLVQRFPEVIPKVRHIYAMFGSVYKCYGNTPGPCPEFNVAQDIPGAAAFINASWPKSITPLDTCDIQLNGTAWSRIQQANDSQHVMASVLMTTLCIWSRGASWWPNCKNQLASDIIYDAVAMYMSVFGNDLNFKTLPLMITPDGKTVINIQFGKPVSAALSWRPSGGVERFFDQLVDWIIAYH